MDKMWQYFGLLGLLIVIYSAIGKPKGNTLKNLWLGYILFAAVLGVMYR